MVTYLLSTLRFSLAVLIQSVLLLYAGTAQASAVYLADGLEIDLPGSLALEVITPEDQLTNPAISGSIINTPIITGRVNGEPAYFIAATKIKTWEKNSILWNRLESGIRNRSNAGKFVISQRGKFPTTIDKAVWFRAYEFESANQMHRQVYFLLNERRNTYWVTLTMVENIDMNLAIPITKALINRARIIEK